MQIDREDIDVKYLLGKLSENKRNAVEAVYFGDRSKFEDILAAETSLLDAYVAGRLSPDDREAFARRLLINPNQKERAKFAQALKNYLDRSSIDELAPDRPESIWSSIANLFTLRSAMSFSLAAALIAGLGVVFWLQLASQRDLPEGAGLQAPMETNVIVGSEPEFSAESPNMEIDTEMTGKGTIPSAKTGQPSSKNAPERRSPIKPVIATFILSVGATRDSGQETRFILDRKTTRVDLIMPIEDGEHSQFFAVIETVEGHQVWRGRVVVTGTQGSRSGKVSVPAARLKTGDYIMSLKGLNVGGVYEPTADLSFAITGP